MDRIVDFVFNYGGTGDADQDGCNFFEKMDRALPDAVYRDQLLAAGWNTNTRIMTVTLFEEGFEYVPAVRKYLADAGVSFEETEGTL